MRLSLSEVADRLGVSVSTVNQLVHRGELRAIRISKRPIYRVSDRDLEAYIERNATAAAG